MSFGMSIRLKVSSSYSESLISLGRSVLTVASKHWCCMRDTVVATTLLYRQLMGIYSASSVTGQHLLLDNMHQLLDSEAQLLRVQSHSHHIYAHFTDIALGMSHSSWTVLSRVSNVILTSCSALYNIRVYGTSTNQSDTGLEGHKVS